MNKFTIGTFNIWKDEGNYPDRIYELSNLIKSNKFDIICLQEDFNSDDFSSSKFLNIELDFNYVTTKTRKKYRKNKLSSSNLTVLSKYNVELLEEQFFYKEKEEERAYQILKIDFHDKELLLINTHLCHLSTRRRLLQIKHILKDIEKYKYEHIFLCGDLNALPNYEEIQIIRNSGFLDKNREFTHKEKVILDYIFHKSNSNLNVKSKVIYENFSDHHCLLNSFSI